MLPDTNPAVEDHEQIRAALIEAMAVSTKTVAELSVVKNERDTLRAERNILKTQHTEAVAEVEKLHNLVEQMRGARRSAWPRTPPKRQHNSRTACHCPGS